jgi:hypothetical protein
MVSLGTVAVSSSHEGGSKGLFAPAPSPMQGRKTSSEQRGLRRAEITVAIVAAVIAVSRR